MLLLLLQSFISASRLELRYISFIKSVRSSFFQLYSFQMLVLLPQFIEISSFVFTNMIHFLCVRPSSHLLEIFAKMFLNLPDEIMQIKQGVLSPPSLKLSCLDMRRITNNVLNKGKSDIRYLLNGPETSSVTDKVVCWNLFWELILTT